MLINAMDFLNTDVPQVKTNGNTILINSDKLFLLRSEKPISISKNKTENATCIQINNSCMYFSSESDIELVEDFDLLI